MGFCSCPGVRIKPFPAEPLFAGAADGPGPSGGGLEGWARSPVWRAVSEEGAVLAL